MPSRSYHRSDPYPELRGVLAPEYAELGADALAETLDSLLGEGAAANLESFLKGVKRFARGAGGVLQKALPVVGTVAGTAFGGPVGATVGGAAGQALSGALGGALRGASRGGGRRVLQGLAGAALHGAGSLVGGWPAAGAAPGGSPAAAQLLQVLRRPETLQALLGMVMGPAGRRTVPVAGAPVPNAAFTNLLGVLANQAAAEHHQAVASESGGVPSYLLGTNGEFIGDPSDPLHRAEVLRGRLLAADLIEAADSEELDEDEAPAEIRRARALELEEMFDEIDLADAYAEEIDYP